MEIGSRGEDRENFVNEDGSLSFREAPEFYAVLDERIKKRQTVNIQFDRDRLDLESKLWPRLRNCKNWREIEAELERLSRREDTLMGEVACARMVTAIGLPGAFLIAWIATLVAGVILFATYRGCKVRFGYAGDGKGTIEIDPT